MPVDIERFKAARIAKGWSQDRLAAEAGVSQTTIDKIENGRTLNSRFLLRLAQALQVPVSELDGSYSHESSQRFASDFASRKHSQLMSSIPLFISRELEPQGLLQISDMNNTIDCPDTLLGAREGYAVIIIGDSMAPAFRSADVAIVNPKKPVVPGSDYLFYRQVEELELAALRYLVGTTPEEWLVERYSPYAQERLDRKDWPKVHRIVQKNYRS